MFTRQRKLRYRPTFSGEPSDKWWLVIDADPQIGSYYRHLYSAKYHLCRTVQRPAWKEHISVIRNEEPPEDKKSLWELYDGQIVTFHYHYELQISESY